MSLFNTHSSAYVEHRAGRLAVAWLIALACLMTVGNAQARDGYSRGERFAHMMQVRGPGFGEERAAERANERAMRQAARGQRQQQIEGQRAAQRSEMMQRRQPEEMQRAPPPEFRAPDPGEGNRMGRPGRLTPEERRALRQQINQADREVYRPNGRP